MQSKLKGAEEEVNEIQDKSRVQEGLGLAVHQLGALFPKLEDVEGSVTKGVDLRGCRESWCLSSISKQLSNLFFNHIWGQGLDGFNGTVGDLVQWGLVQRRSSFRNRIASNKRSAPVASTSAVYSGDSKLTATWLWAPKL